MTPSKFLQYFAVFTLFLSLLTILDHLLPTIEDDTKVVKIYRPKNLNISKHGTRSMDVRSDQIILKTEQGKIKISLENFNSTVVGDEVILRKTMIYGFGKSLFQRKSNMEVSTSNIFIKWFLILAIIVMITSLFTILSADNKVVNNVGSWNLAIFFFALYFLFKEHFIG